jgi:hypothetical protein
MKRKLTDAEFKQLVAEIMEYIYAKRRIPNKLWARWPKGCRDCGHTEPEFYMAKDDVWIKAGRIGTKHGVLCLSCFGKRLGRRLRRSDFSDPPRDEDDKPIRLLKSQ